MQLSTTTSRKNQSVINYLKKLYKTNKNWAIFVYIKYNFFDMWQARLLLFIIIIVNFHFHL